MFKKFGRWLVAIMGIIPMVAFADTTGPFTVPDTDISLKILSQIFGSLTPIAGNDAFKSAITTFNGAVLIVGGILATYTLLAGTLGTAHDGEMLGKKFSSVWIPIRYALGTALVLPVLSGGYCVMQQLVMWCILQGVGLANSVWMSYLQSPNLTAKVYMTTNTKKSVLDFANNVAMAQICTQANASVLNDGSTAGGLIDKISKSIMNYDYKVAYNADGTSAYFGDQYGKLSVITKYNCGFANLPKKPDASVITPTSSASGGKLGDISQAFQLGDVSPVYTAHINQSKKLIEDMGVLAKSAVTAETPLKESDIITAADAYVKGIENAANTYSNGNGSPFAGIIAASGQQGWILAGAWFTKLAMMNQTLNDAVNSVPTASYTLQLGSSFKFLDVIQPRISAARTEILEAMNTSVPDSDSDEKDNSQGKQTQSSGIWSKIVQSVVQVFTGLDLEKLQNTDKHPILVLQDAGNRMITAWSVSITTLMVVIAPLGIKILGNGFDAAPLVFTFIGFAMLPIAGLVALGFTLAYLLPNLPFLMWIGIVLGWLIMCVEAVLAAPLWAVMHLHPNGDDLTGRGGNGYMLLLGLLLRPALTIFGLIAALVLTELMGEFVNKIFFSVFFSGTGAGLTTILTVIFSMTVYTSAMMQLFRKTFSLMHVIPDQLMRWIGGGQEQMGQYAGGLAEAGQKGVQAAGQTGSFLGERTAQTTGQIIGHAKNLSDKNNADKARKAAIDNEKNSQNEQFTQAGLGQKELSEMNDRTKGTTQALEKANPQSKQGIELGQSQQKMLNARKEGLGKVSQVAGPNGQLAYSQALASGSFSNGKESRTLASFKNQGSNEFEAEANFANFVSSAIVTQSTESQKSTSENAQLQQQNDAREQTQSLKGIEQRLNNLGKNEDPLTTPQVGGSGNTNLGGGNGGVAVNLPKTQNNIPSGQLDLFGNQHDNIVNNALQTDLNGNLLNPALAQAVASSSSVNPVGRGLTSNAVNIIQHGANTPVPQPSINPQSMSAEQNPGASIGGFTPEINQTGQIDSGTDLNTSAQLPRFDSPSQSFDNAGIDSDSISQLPRFDSPSQSFDGSGSSQTGNNPPINDIDR